MYSDLPLDDFPYREIMFKSDTAADGSSSHFKDYSESKRRKSQVMNK